MSRPLGPGVGVWRHSIWYSHGGKDDIKKKKKNRIKLVRWSCLLPPISQRMGQKKRQGLLPTQCPPPPPHPPKALGSQKNPEHYDKSETVSVQTLTKLGCGMSCHCFSHLKKTEGKKIVAFISSALLKISLFLNTINLILKLLDSSHAIFLLFPMLE